MIFDWLIQIFVERLLQLPPRITRQGDVLVAETPWITHFLCLFYGSRKVLIDPTARTVKLRKRFAWFVLNEHVYRFDQILNLIADYRDWSLSQLSWSGAYRDRGIFTVELRLTTGERILLFRFYAQGDFVNDGIFPDLMYWGDFLEASVSKGDNYTHSEAYAEVAAGIIGVRVYSD
jgi:hypothetical protein